MFKPLLLALSLMSAPAHSDTIEDFSGNPASRWAFFTDQVMGGVSTGNVAVTTDGLRLTGTVSTDNNGGFIQARMMVDGLPEDAKAIRLQVRGNGERYYVHLRTRGTLLPWQFYQAGFDTTGGWQEVTLPISAFEAKGGKWAKLKARSVKSLAVVAYGADYQADLSVRNISVD